MLTEREIQRGETRGRKTLCGPRARQGDQTLSKGRQRCGQADTLDRYSRTTFISFQKELRKGIWIEPGKRELQGPPFSGSCRGRGQRTWREDVGLEEGKVPLGG